MPHLLFFLLVAQVQPTFRSDIALVHVDAEVLGDRQSVADLSKDDFRITDEEGRNRSCPSATSGARGCTPALRRVG